MNEPYSSVNRHHLEFKMSPHANVNYYTETFSDVFILMLLHHIANMSIVTIVQYLVQIILAQTKNVSKSEQSQGKIHNISLYITILHIKVLQNNQLHKQLQMHMYRHLIYM